MLDLTLATAFEPGTNLKGMVTGANWVFLLPSLELERIVCVGTPSPPTIAMLSGIGRDVTVFCRNERGRHAPGETNGHGSIQNANVITVFDQGVIPFPDDSVDLVMIANRQGLRQLSHANSLQAELQRLLKPDGLIYLDVGGIIGRLTGAKDLESLAACFGSPKRFWLTPWDGEMHTAVPLGDRATTSRFLEGSLYSSSVDTAKLKRLLKRRQSGRGPNEAGGLVEEGANDKSPSSLKSKMRTSAHSFLRALQRGERFLVTNYPPLRRQGAFLGSDDVDLSERPPEYVRSLARQAGIDLEEYRWGMTASGDYSSRKVLVFLYGPEGDAAGGPGPNYIVKMVRDPIFNYRLENECRGLRRLAETGFGRRAILPRIAFCGHHGGLAVVGETLVDGSQFRQRTEAVADCKYARAAINWLTDLGTETADPAHATPDQVAEAMGILFGRFSEIYRLSSAHRDFLSGQIASLASSEKAFPSVFQHGDPGAWNALVTPDGRVTFLDWEASEPKGMPLWDLFYFLRSHCIGVGRAQGTHDRLTIFRRHFLEETPFSRLVIDSTRQYCHKVKLAPEIVEPLFYLCWMHRALKEAARLTTPRLEEGVYVRLLRLCIDRQDSTVLSKLFLRPVTSSAPTFIMNEHVNRGQE
jgi:SAM-dependent methyltransferase